MRKTILIGSTVLLLQGFTGTPLRGASALPYEGRDTVRIQFRQDQDTISREDFLRIVNLLDSIRNTNTERIHRITIEAFASPEWKERSNTLLSERRVLSIKKALQSIQDADTIPTEIRFGRRSWDEAYELAISEGITLPSRESWDLRDDNHKALCLRWYREGIYWERIKSDVLPQMRTGLLTVSTRMKPFLTSAAIPSGLAETAQKGLFRQEIHYVPGKGTKPFREPVITLKTNILADAASLLNAGAEIPFGDRFSISAQAAFPWWKNTGRDITVQMLSGTLEARYRPGNRTGKEPLTGFFTGAYAGAGLFDFQAGRLSSGEGVQGEYITAGLLAGYSHALTENLHLEYSLGAGYLRAQYDRYSPEKGTRYGDIKVIGYPWNSKRLTSLLPTRVAVSLVWVIRKGGAR